MPHGVQLNHRAWLLVAPGKAGGDSSGEARGDEMTKFMVLYRSSTSARDQMANATPEQMKAGMEAWMQWAAKAGDAVVDLGAPLTPARMGPGSSDAGEISGYSIMQADSAEALGGVLDGHPHLSMPGNSIEVLEMLSMPGM
jgi:hypothetical protein